MASFFITSTGTEIGKTFVTASIAHEIIMQGKNVSAYKPLISGWQRDDVAMSDTAILCRALQLPENDEQYNKISPYRYSNPLSPDMAARIEQRPLCFDSLVGYCQELITNNPTDNTLLIEGVGGVAVPLTENKLVSDWINALKTPVIMVIGSYLGTLSHTISAYEVLCKNNIPLHAIIVNESPGDTPPFEETLTSLANFVDCPIIPLRYNERMNANTPWLEDAGLIHALGING